MSGQSAFDEKNILKTAGESRGLMEELNLPPKVIAVIRQNARILQIAIVCAVVAIVGWNYYGNYTQNRNDRASAALSEAMNTTDQDQRLVKLKEVVEQYSRTGAATWGQLELGHLAAEKGNFDDAVKSYENVLDDISSSDPLVPLIRLSLAHAYVSSGQSEKALKIYENLVGLKGFDLESQFAIARIYESQGKAEKVKEIYGRLLAQEELPPGIKEILESKLADL